MEKILKNVKKPVRRDMDVFITETSRHNYRGTEVMERKYELDENRWVKSRMEGNLILFAYYVKGSAVPMVVVEGTYGHFDYVWNKFRTNVSKWHKTVEEHTI